MSSENTLIDGIGEHQITLNCLRTHTKVIIGMKLREAKIAIKVCRIDRCRQHVYQLDSVLGLQESLEVPPHEMTVQK